VSTSSRDQLNYADARAALVVGHPGHELLVHGWLEETKPLVFVLTDGSGRSSKSRLASTSNVLNDVGSRAGSIYGRLTDADAYAALLNQDFNLFVDLVKELAGAFITENINYVVGDAFEGYNPMHDTCRLVTNAAVAVAMRTRGEKLANFEFSQINKPGDCRNASHENGIRRLLDDYALERKLTAARAYTQLAGEVLSALEKVSSDAFKVECLHAVDPNMSYDGDQIPFYEEYGARQVAAGYYQRVLRYREHLAPLATALNQFVASNAVQLDFDLPLVEK
jgi:hypothetical protein